MFDGSGEEDEKLSKSLIFLHGVTLNFIEFDFEELVVVFYIGLVEGGIIVDFDGDFL